MRIQKEYPFPEENINADILPGLRGYKVTRINDETFQIKGHVGNTAQIGTEETEREVLYNLVSSGAYRDKAETKRVGEFSTFVTCGIGTLNELTEELDKRGFPDETVFPPTPTKSKPSSLIERLKSLFKKWW